MPNPKLRLELIDATELAETLTFISQWFAGVDHAHLASSFADFLGIDGYDLDTLRTDLARFASLLGHDGGDELFGHDQRDAGRP